MSELLRLSGVDAWYGSSQALFGVDFTIAAGATVALLGRNGMGKTTIIRSICGMMSKVAGQICFKGSELGGLPSYRIAQQGIGLVPEGRRCFGPLSVQENLISAQRAGPWDLDRVYEMFPRLGERQAQMANLLSGGEQQMLAIGRALMTNPQFLILDEATEGLAPVVRSEIWQAIRNLKETGITTLIVDKSLKDLLAISDQCVVIEKGSVRWSGQSAGLRREIVSRYLGV